MTARIPPWCRTILFGTLLVVPALPAMASRPYAHRSNAEQDRQGPRQLWSRRLPGAVSLAAEDRWLLVRPYGPGCQVLDPETGRTAMEARDCVLARVTGGLLVTARPVEGSRRYDPRARWTIEATNVSSRDTEWSIDADGEPGLGDVVGGCFYYGDRAGLHRLPIPPRNPTGEQVRAFPESFTPQPRVWVDRVWFSDGHKLYSLDAGDLTRGWWYYCDCAPVSADEDGAYSISTNGYGLDALSTAGKRIWRPWSPERGRIAHGRDFFRDTFSVSGDYLVVGGRDFRSPVIGPPEERWYAELGTPVVTSPYLYALRKRTGELIWRKPMAAVHPVVAGGKVVVWAGHRHTRRVDISPYPGNVGPGLDWRLEVRDLSSGRLRWSGRRRRDSLPALEALGPRFFTLDRGVLTGLGWRSGSGED